MRNTYHTCMLVWLQNVFATAPETLMAAGESFFSSLLSGRHESQRDETGAYFIDREWRAASACPARNYLKTDILIVLHL